MPTVSPVAGYVFGDKNDYTKTSLFVQMLLRHQIEVTYLADTWKDADFEKGKAFAVSLNQPQSTLIKTIFENVPVYKDSIFYDITAWNMPLAFGLPFKNILNPASGVFGKKVDNISTTNGIFHGVKSNVGYLIEWNDFNSPLALYQLLHSGIITKVATGSFEIYVTGGNKKFEHGTLLVPVSMQTKSAEEIYNKLSELVSRYGIKVYDLGTGNSVSGIDPGSSKFIPVTKPTIAMIAGPGVNATDAGEVWHLLDQRMNIPASHLEPSMFNRADLNKYNTLIMVGGTYTELNKEKLKTWVQSGGTLILTEEAVTWAAQNGITDIKFKKGSSPVDSASRMAYTDKEQVDGAQQIAGAIFGAEADLAHPLAYGYTQSAVSLFKANKVFMEKSKNPYATPFYYGSKPLQSGWVSQENYAAIKNSAAVIVNTVGNGRVINIADNPNFRAFWLGGSKLFMNAIFFGRIIDAASGRTE